MRVILYLLVAVALSACSILPESGTNESLAVNYLLSKATTQIIDGDQARAERVLQAVEDARAYVETGESVTIEALYQGAMDRIKQANLDPADQILMESILANARARLETAVSAGKLEPSERVAILDALSWIERSARHDLQ